MAFLTLEDKLGTLEVVAFPEVFNQSRELLEQDEPKVVIGTVQHDEKGSKVIAERILTLEDAQVEAVESVRIHLKAEQLNRDTIERLRHLLISHAGECETFLHVDVEREAEAVIALNAKLRVNPTASFFLEMGRHFGEGTAEPVLRMCRQ
jgi:DNA polymerase-3 subunit alpha